ncbi:thioredoxin-related protein-like protein [Flammeovirgaceae bacterium 311]|nr:thioredoxin-related protein-like protein [Flammeovirgaceae bacterium 311]
MKKQLISGLLLVFMAMSALAFRMAEPGTAARKGEIKWLTLEEAYVLNQQEPRKIFVDVYTDWCGWCKRMDKDTFSNSEVAAYVDKNYYAVKLNAESDRAFKLGEAEMTERQVARQLGVSGYPTVVFIYEDFRTIEPVSGYQQADQFMKTLQAFAAKKLNP